MKIGVDVERTGLKVKIHCSNCNLKEYGFKMDGIVIPKSEWRGEKIFRIKQFGHSAATYITEEALEELLSRKFTNLRYKEVGYIE